VCQSNTDHPRSSEGDSTSGTGRCWSSRPSSVLAGYNSARSELRQWGSTDHSYIPGTDRQPADPVHSPSATTIQHNLYSADHSLNEQSEITRCKNKENRVTTRLNISQTSEISRSRSLGGRSFQSGGQLQRNIYRQICCQFGEQRSKSNTPANSMLANQHKFPTDAQYLRRRNF